MNKLCLALVLFFNLSLTAQIQFEEGYYVDNNGNRIDGFIKNSDWNFVPAEFDFKSTESATAKTISLNEIMEFEVGAYHFEKFDVQLDVSSRDVNKMSYQRAPEFEDKTIFLRYLVEGEASLLSYRKNNIEKFYYRTLDKGVQPLIFKNYLVNGKMGENNRFKQQLSNDFNCDKISGKINFLKYKEKDLVEYFADYNECKGNEFTVKLDKSRSGHFTITPRIGLGNGTLQIDNELVEEGTELSSLEFRIGATFEYNFNFNRNKWSAIIEPTYRTFNDETFVSREYDADLMVKYNSLSVFSGIRHYFFLNENSKLYPSIGVNLDLPIGSEILFANTNRAMDPILEELDFNMGVGLGLGYNLNNKLDIEVRYSANSVKGEKFVDGNYSIEWKSKYQSVSLNLGYKLF